MALPSVAVSARCAARPWHWLLSRRSHTKADVAGAPAARRFHRTAHGHFPRRIVCTAARPWHWVVAGAPPPHEYANQHTDSRRMFRTRGGEGRGAGISLCRFGRGSAYKAEPRSNAERRTRNLRGGPSVAQGSACACPAGTPLTSVSAWLRRDKKRREPLSTAILSLPWNLNP